MRSSFSLVSSNEEEKKPEALQQTVAKWFAWEDASSKRVDGTVAFVQDSKTFTKHAMQLELERQARTYALHRKNNEYA